MGRLCGAERAPQWSSSTVTSSRPRWMASRLPPKSAQELFDARLAEEVYMYFFEHSIITHSAPGCPVKYDGIRLPGFSTGRHWPGPPQCWEACCFTLLRRSYNSRCAPGNTVKPVYAGVSLLAPRLSWIAITANSLECSLLRVCSTSH